MLTGGVFLEQTLYGLRMISLFGCLVNPLLLLINLIMILFFKSSDQILLYSWKLFFMIAMLSLVAALSGYTLHRYFKNI